MKLNKAVLVPLALAIAGTLFAQKDDPSAKFRYRFDRGAGNLELKGGASLVDGVLRLDGKTGYAVVPDSKGMHLTEKGMTLVGVVKLNDGGVKSGENDAHDMILSKGREFIFGRSDKNLYVNFHDGRTWAATTIGGKKPEPGVWTHFAAVFERFNDPAQGDVGYRLSIFINGEPEVRKRFLMVNPKATDDPVEIGKGFGGGPWFLHGDIAEVAMYDRSLTDGEVAKLFSESSLVEITRKGFVKLNPELQQTFESLLKTASPEGKWLLNSLLRMGKTGYPPGKLQKTVSALTSVVAIHGAAEISEAFNTVQKDFKILTTDSMAALIAVGSGTGASPLAGVMNRSTAKDIFGERSLSWSIAYRKGTANAVLENNDPGVSWNVESIKQSRNAASFRITWKNAAPDFRAESEVLLSGPRLESTFALLNAAPDTVVSEVAYPVYSFARLTSGGDTMVLPWMSGILVRNPMEEQFIFGQEGTFPSGRIPLQFGAYYDEADGIYFGFEDGLARTKRYSAIGKRGNLNISWISPVPAAPDGKGGNSFKINGKAVVELYQGKWFEAGSIYRRFLENEAKWWIPELPRKDTPEWFRDNTLWILGFAATPDSAENMKNEAAYLRTYFELPFGIHWYGWDDSKTKGWPHFYPKPFSLKVCEELHKEGVYVIPYIDSRLWQINDGPDNTDYMYRSHGLKYAAKNADGSVNNENYGKNQVFTVMCPAAGGWRDWMVALSERVASYGFDAIYHDQVGTAAPKLCFDKTHGHPLNDGAAWLEQGYWPMFDSIREVLKKKYPNVCHTTEEGADPYLRAMDGYMVWRWVDANQVPLFQSLYSGRIQFVGRVYNHQKQGDPQSFFSKAAQQFVNAEQLGWFPFSELRAPTEKRLFIKKLMHLRKALLPYFNEGTMLPPIVFKASPGQESCKWGGNFPQVVTMPKIANSAFLLKDGTTTWLFVNTVNETVSATPEIPGSKTIWICREGASKPVKRIPGQTVTLSPRSSEIWLMGDLREAERIQATMKKIAGFDCGAPSLPVTGKLSFNPSAGKSGTWLTPENIVSVFECEIAEGKTHVGRIRSGALISFGEIDFGSKGCRQMEFKLAVAPEYEGGSLDVIVRKKDSGEETVGSLKLQSTGGFHEFREFSLPLRKTLTGKYAVGVRINGEAACNFKAWRFSE